MDLGAPMAVWRGGARMVPLIDLWVATMLGGDIFDLKFKIVTSGATPKVKRSALIDGLLFARGFVAVATRELWWDAPEDGVLNGFRAHAVLVRSAIAQAPVEPDPTAPRSPSDVDLERLLPRASLAYPAVEWRRAGS